MNLPTRKRNRLQEYDYGTPAAYFVTICAHNHKKLFGTIVGGDLFHAPIMQLSSIGAVVNHELQSIETYYPNIKIAKYVVMPNHVHMIIHIAARINPCPTKADDISNVIGKFKAAVTRRVRKEGYYLRDAKIWQFSFHDHIIRNQKDYDEIWTYIDNNPAKWKEDRLFVK